MQQTVVVTRGRGGAHAIEQRNPHRIALTIHRAEFDGGKRRVLEDRRVEEVWRVVPQVAARTRLLLRHDRRQLKRIAEHHDANATEGQVVAFRHAHGDIDGVDHIGAHHRDFVDDQQSERSRHLQPLAALNVTGGERLEGKAEERMDRLSAGIERGKTGGRQHHALRTLGRGDLPQHRALAGARPSGHEQRPRLAHIEPVVQLGQLGAPAAFHVGQATRRSHHFARYGGFLRR